MQQMTCPKCHGDMRMYERSGVTVDQCTECRGIFLDRGELEKLFEAEATYNAAPQSAPGAPPQAPRPQQAPPPPAAPSHGGGYAAPPPPPSGYPAPGYPQAPQPAYGAPGYGAPAYGQHGGYHGHYRNKRQKSFLHDLFD